MIHEDTRKRSKLLQEIAEDQRLKHGSAWPASRKWEGLGVAENWPSPSDAHPLFRLLGRKRTGGNPLNPATQTASTGSTKRAFVSYPATSALGGFRTIRVSSISRSKKISL
jgi:hypothetical protein